LFWLLVLKISAHGWLVLLLWISDEEETSWREGMVEVAADLMAVKRQKERGRGQRQDLLFQGMAPVTYFL
jgi:hypothetical protein